jgi:ABC-type transporter MlaC component
MKKDEPMKTLTALALTTAIALSFSTTANANAITDTITENVSAQLNELSANIKNQAQSALEKTAAELFFSTGTKQAEHSVVKAQDLIAGNTTANSKK